MEIKQITGFTEVCTVGVAVLFLTFGLVILVGSTRLRHLVLRGYAQRSRAAERLLGLAYVATAGGWLLTVRWPELMILVMLGMSAPAAMGWKRRTVAGLSTTPGS
ncbi:hypothetical protein [Nocardia stercoris]|uniref:Uncharacterized protein n=1 Tax=Nocardia stercoris TaxID=2483361 RepID=A0A3M2L957_9NOCA|nr:hypothetical protein [Nocardia stercoris]RMI34109.1 hypothetical protein EBN03_06675 [Nocardia stercoris]